MSRVITYSVTAETAHEIGRDGVIRIKRWLDATGRFAMSHTAYDLDEDKRPFTQVRVDQLDGSAESFDLVGELRDADGKRGRTVYVECKKYATAADQGTLYGEYLATVYSAFAAEYGRLQNPPSAEFMWVTTHPFAVTKFGQLCSESELAAACSDERWSRRLGGSSYDDELGRELAPRLWLLVVSDRMLDDMLMGPRLRKAVSAELAELGVL